MKRLPKKIKYVVDKEDMDRFFYGRDHFFLKLWAIFVKALRQEDLLINVETDILLDLELKISATYYNFYKSIGANLCIVTFTSSFMDGKIDIMFFGRVDGSGQIAEITVKPKWKKEKVIFN